MIPQYAISGGVPSQPARPPLSTLRGGVGATVGVFNEVVDDAVQRDAGLGMIQ